MATGFWDGLRVAVTGGCGFVGSHLVLELLARGARVYVIDDQSTGTYHYPGGIEYVYNDAGNSNSCEYVFRGCSTRGKPVDVIFNLAATVAGVLYNVTHHHEMFINNVQLQTVPVMVADELGVPIFVQVSSVCVYDPEYNHPAIEEEGLLGEPIAANAGYSWSKRMGEYAIYWSNIKRGVVVRPNNMYGPHDHFSREKAHVIPALIRKFMEDDVVHVMGSRDVVREFLYVQDAVEGMLAAAKNGDNKAAYNLGCNKDPGCAVTIGELVSIIQEATGEIDKQVVWHEEFKGGDPARWSNCQLANEELQWSHATTLKLGIAKTMEWLKDSGVMYEW